MIKISYEETSEFFFININILIKKFLIKNILNFRVKSSHYNNGVEILDPNFKESEYVFEIKEDDFKKYKFFKFSFLKSELKNISMLKISFCDEGNCWFDSETIRVNLLPYIKNKDICKIDSKYNIKYKRLTNNNAELIINPGSFKHNGLNYLMLRKEKNNVFFKGNYQYFFKNKPTPLLGLYDDKTNSILEYKEMSFINFPVASRPEDFRTFSFKNKIYSNISLHLPMNFKEDSKNPNLNVIINRNKHTTNFANTICKQCIAEVDVRNKKIIFIKSFKEFSECEKNWSFFEKNNKLFFIYSLTPLKIYSLDNNFSNIKLEYEKEFDFSFSVQNDSKHLVSLGTNLIRLDDYYLGFFHVKDTYPAYYNGLFILDDDFNIKYISSEPEFYGYFPNSQHDRIMYISSAAIEKDTINIFFGEGDKYTGIIKIDKKEVLDLIQ